MSSSWMRTAAICVAVVGGGYGACKVLKKATRSDRMKELEKRQDTARDVIGGGLDDVFDAQLDKEEQSVQMTARLDVASSLGQSSYSDYDCGKGFEQAFEEVLGKDVISVSTLGIGRSDKDLELEVAAKVTPNGHDFVLPNSHDPYPGIILDGTVTFAGKTVPVKVEPGSDISFEYSRMQGELGKISAAEVNGGILQATCKEAAFVWLEKTTKWKRPEAPPPPDPATECEKGFHCVEAGDAIAAKNPGKAEELYSKACQADDSEACSRLARIALERAPGSEKSRAYVTLDMTCRVHENATACVGGAQVALIPIHDNGKIGDYERDEAIPLALRGCDLGERDGCEVAAPLLKDTPFADAAPVLVSDKPVVSKKLGRVFAVKWGQWTHSDGGQATVWTATKPASPPAGALVKEFSGDQLPKGLNVPEGVGTVWAIALSGGHGGDYDRTCDQCMPSGGGGSVYSMPSLDCVCVLAPHGREDR